MMAIFTTASNNNKILDLLTNTSRYFNNNGLFRGVRPHCTAAVKGWGKEYDFTQIEAKWQRLWTNQESTNLQEYQMNKKKKFYVLSMFPYPSGKLHMGHVRVYAMSHCVAQFRKMRGFQVIHPMGWDAFGLPAENAALERNCNPNKWTYSNIRQMKAQMINLGLQFDWEKEISTCSPDYYKWTQWLFLRMFDAGLAYQRQALVNWDPVDQTVLAKEQIDDSGRSWRSGTLVEMKLLKQWYLKLSCYADSLLAGLNDLQWPENVKQLQRRWLGKKKLMEFKFYLKDDQHAGEYNQLNVYTDAPHFAYGATYVAVALDHPLVSAVMKNNSRIIYNREIEFPLGISVINPLNGRSIPVYVASYVLSDFGSLAILGIPGHGGKREKAFAEKFNIPVLSVLDSNGRLINSCQFTGMNIDEAAKAIVNHAKRMKFGSYRILYKISDWLISRQRYWGTPIPIIHCDSCGAVPVPKKDLPVKLPEYSNISRSKRFNLQDVPQWVTTSCPSCGRSARKETDTMDTFVDSAWYFLRYLNPNNESRPFEKASVEYAMPVDLYIGGIEHAILHLLYARFVNHFLKDFGYISNKEPFERLLAQGMVHGLTYKVISSGKYLERNKIDINANQAVEKSTGKEITISWEKMSKSKYNGVNPQDVAKTYGADAVRLFLLFKAPPDNIIHWDVDAIIGMTSWLNRLWNMVTGFASTESKPAVMKTETTEMSSDEYDAELLRATYQATKQVTNTLEKTFTFNVAIAACMKLSNILQDVPSEIAQQSAQYPESLRTLCILLSPFAPHITSELWHVLCLKFGLGSSHVLDQSWPTYNDLALSGEKTSLQIIINGRRKGTIAIPVTVIGNEEALLRLVRESEIGDGLLRDKVIQKFYVAKHGKLISFVTEP